MRQSPAAPGKTAALESFLSGIADFASAKYKKDSRTFLSAMMAVRKVLLSLFRSRALAVLTTSVPAGSSGSQLLPFLVLTLRSFVSPVNALRK